MAETPGIDIPAGVEPTAEQYSEINRFVREYSGKRAFMVDISNQNGSNVGTYTYEGRVNADRVVNDIKYFYQNGEVREQSEVSRYLYSDRDPDAGKMNRILQKQDAELKDTVQYLRELVRLQGKVTDGTVYTRGSVEWAAKRMIRDAGAKGDAAELTKILEGIYHHYNEKSTPKRAFSGGVRGI